LVSIQSQEENDFVKALITQTDSNSESWIGLTDEDIEGSFRWVAGTSFSSLPSFFNWGPHQPNAAGDHVMMTSDGTWLDTSGDDDICLFVCEIPAPLCVAPKRVAHGAVSGSDNASGFILNSTVSYLCDQGYTLQGPAVRTCNSIQVWSGAEPQCVPTSPLSTASIWMLAIIGSIATVGCLLVVCFGVMQFFSNRNVTKHVRLTEQSEEDCFDPVSVAEIDGSTADDSLEMSKFEGQVHKC
jgi:hypothetical protein